MRKCCNLVSLLLLLVVGIAAGYYHGVCSLASNGHRQCVSTVPSAHLPRTLLSLLTQLQCHHLCAHVHPAAAVYPTHYCPCPRLAVAAFAHDNTSSRCKAANTVNQSSAALEQPQQQLKSSMAHCLALLHRSRGNKAKRQCRAHHPKGCTAGDE